ncbi:MAG: YjfB family protein [Lachnospiraceae bacterium]|nr:YjfB family protein [Lachnospiraceae bacterium]
MDISGIGGGIDTAAAMANSTTGVQRQVATQVAAMGLDQMEQQGEDLKKMMEMSVNPNLGGKFDVSV